jgi:hypothetical protein
MRRWHIAMGFLAIAIGFHTSCDSFMDSVIINNAPYCDPATVRTCTCNTGGVGQQVCHSDGRDYGPCVCSDAGVPGDAATVDDAKVRDNSDHTLDAGGEQ